MAGHSLKRSKPNETEIDFKRIQDVIYWAKKWEVSPHQLMVAAYAINSSNVKKIEEYLREKGFAL